MPKAGYLHRIAQRAVRQSQAPSRRWQLPGLGEDLFGARAARSQRELPHRDDVPTDDAAVEHGPVQSPPVGAPRAEVSTSRELDAPRSSSRLMPPHAADTKPTAAAVIERIPPSVPTSTPPAHDDIGVPDTLPSAPDRRASPPDTEALDARSRETHKAERPAKSPGDDEYIEIPRQDDGNTPSRSPGSDTVRIAPSLRLSVAPAPRPDPLALALATAVEWTSSDENIDRDAAPNAPRPLRHDPTPPASRTHDVPFEPRLEDPRSSPVRAAHSNTVSIGTIEVHVGDAAPGSIAPTRARETSEVEPAAALTRPTASTFGLRQS